jgi:hypothetical protein
LSEILHGDEFWQLDLVLLFGLLRCPLGGTLGLLLCFLRFLPVSFAGAASVSLYVLFEVPTTT